MEDPQRVQSAKNSRRRRWEVKSKESFETSLAFEIESPHKKETSEKLNENQDDKFYSADLGPKKEKSTNPFEQDEDEDLTKPSARATSSKPSSATSKVPRPPKSKPSSAKSKPSSAKSKPLSAKSKPLSAKSKDLKPDNGNDTDMLSAKLGALIDKANVKNIETHRRSAKEREGSLTPKEEKEKVKSHTPKEEKDKGRSHTPKEEEEILREHSPNYEPPTEPERMQGHFVYSDYPPKYTETYDNNIGTDSSTEPSAPPLSLSPSPEAPPKRRKHKKKSESKLLLLNAANEESFISLQLKEMKDDIIDVTQKSSCIIDAPGLLRASSLPTVHGNINAIFQERIGGFVMTSHDDSNNHKLSERLQDVTQVQTRTSYAVFLQSGFRTFSVLCQGLLAGITLSHCLMIFMLEADPIKLPSLYNSQMAHIYYALVIFLTTICFTSSCDRCDLSGIGVFSGHGIKIPWTPAFYLSSLVLSLVAVRTEDVLAHGALYQDTLQQDQIKDLVDWWRWICVARSSTAVLAWLAVVPDPHTDALLDSIHELHRK